MNTENKMTTLALIGKGRWGTNYLSEIKKIPNSEIKYIKTYDYKDLLNYNDINGIIIATPAETHAEIISAFPNKFLLVEKPLTISLPAALAITNKNITVGHTYLFNDSIMKTIAKMGSILQFNFTLHNTDSYGSKVGPIWELAPHPVSLFLKISDGDVNITYAKLVDGNLAVRMKSRHCKCNISIGWNYTEKKRDISFVGHSSIFKFDGTEINQISPLQNEVQSFIDFIHGGENKSTLEDSIKVIELLTRIEKTCMK